jgi:hypothetical protein
MGGERLNGLTIQRAEKLEIEKSDEEKKRITQINTASITHHISL